MSARLTMAVVVAALLAGACGAGPDPAPDSVGTTTPPASGPPPPDHPVELVADLAPGEATGVGQAVNAFGFDLLGEVTDGTENAVTSPVSVATMLAMALAGASGDTAEALAGVLHLEDSRDVRVGALLRQLSDTDEVTLSVANGLWSNDGVPLRPDYLEFIQGTFDATAEETDLGGQRAADDIDAWVAEHTEGLIDGIAADLGLPDPQAVLVLLNAVYFLGEWTTQFDPADTHDEPFTLPDGTTAEVPLMRLTSQTFGYAQRAGYRMLRLPYGAGGRYGMEIMLPDDGSSLPALLGSIDATEWQTAVDSLTEQEISTVVLPRFELEWAADLTEPLHGLGMNGDDFSAMSPAVPSLDTVVHKTYLRVDEAGTEAAAVTGGLARTSEGTGFRVDRPFAFTISDRETGTVLFLGAVTDPR